MKYIFKYFPSAQLINIYKWWIKSVSSIWILVHSLLGVFENFVAFYSSLFGCLKKFLFFLRNHNRAYSHLWLEFVAVSLANRIPHFSLLEINFSTAFVCRIKLVPDFDLIYLFDKLQALKAESSVEAEELFSFF